MVEDHRPRAGGALVDSRYKIGNLAPPRRSVVGQSSMMDHMGAPESENSAIADMPRGGYGASCLDRLLQTDRPEYLDRDNVGDAVKRQVIDALDRTGATPPRSPLLGRATDHDAARPTHCF
jgi:hypothetical protein